VRTTQGLFATIGFALAACQGSPGPAGPTPTAAAQAPAKAEPPAKPQPPLAQVREDVPLPLPAVLGVPVAEVEKKLGAPTGKGMMRSTCVRFVPERTFFACKYTTQRYADPHGNFAGVSIEYEDGIATGIAFDGWKKATGPVEPAPLLAAIGLTLPEQPDVDTPAEGVRRWQWFNHKARLLLGGKQHRVEMSTAGDSWERTRIEIVLNEQLTPEQKAKIVQPARESAPEATPDAKP
jgi:hypothetical protein